MSLSGLGKEFNDNAVKHGFWEHAKECPETTIKAEKLALVHSEVSECLEAVRKPGPDKYCPDYSAEEVELADALIRILDYCHQYGIRIDAAVDAKHQFNKTRPYKHGKTL